MNRTVQITWLLRLYGVLSLNKIKGSKLLTHTGSSFNVEC